MKKVNLGMLTVVATLLGAVLCAVLQLFVSMVAVCEVTKRFKNHNYDIPEEN